MRLIAHRGNIKGSNPENENHPEYIDSAIKLLYDVEIDLRVVDGNFYLGHDNLQYHISTSWIVNRKHRLWVHCKNSNALEVCLSNKINCFWHDTDDYTLTSKGFVWAYPGKIPVSKNSIFVMPENHFSIDFIKQFDPYGICSDIVESYR
jgi:hypothetical protein